MMTKSDIAQELFSALTKQHPAPWSCTYHQRPQHDEQLIAEVIAFNGEPVLYLETFTGDGDRLYIGNEGVLALVKFVNAMHAATA